MNMKKVITTLVATLICVIAFAQNSSLLRPRMEIAQVESEDHDTMMEVFYMNDESPRTYYLSLGHLGVGTDLLQVNIDPVYEAFIPLGANIEQTIAKLQEIKEMYKLPRLDSTEITGYFSALYPGGEPMVFTVTSRRFIFSRFLEFSIPVENEDLVRATNIYRSDFNSLLTSVKIYKAIHPDE